MGASPTVTGGQHGLPRGGTLPAAEWPARHRVVLVALAGHLGVLPVLAVARSEHEWPVWAGLAVVAALFVATIVRLPRPVHELTAASALVLSSVLLLQIHDAAPYTVFHGVLVIGLVGLYERWTPLLVALTYVAGLLTLAPADVFSDGVPSWQQRVATAVLFTAVTATLLAFWRLLDRTRARESGYQEALTQSDDAVRRQLAELHAMREQLIATVSHEFRTPLTAIRGSALTLRRRRHRLDPQRTEEMLDGMVDNVERLSRLLENMLAAADASSLTGPDATDVYGVATEVAMIVHGRHAGRKRSPRTPPVAVAVPRGLVAAIERDALHQALENLVDNAIVHSAPGSQAILSGFREEAEIVITVANEAQGIDAATLAGLFEPFTVADPSDTRDADGAGVGLFVVRRIVDAAGGTISVRSEPGWVSLEMRLRAVTRPTDNDTVVDLTTPEPGRLPPA